MPLPVENADIETASEGYARRFASRAGQWMLGLQKAIVCGWLDAHPGERILDVGGGHGQLALPLAERGRDVTVQGSDASCRDRIAAEVESGRVHFVEGNLLGLPFADQSFGAVTCIRLLAHCERWPELIAELCRVAKERVIVDYATVVSLNVVSNLFFPLKIRLEGNTRRFKVFGHREIRAEFARHGFRPGRQKAQYFLPMVLHRVLNQPAFSSGMESAFAALGLTRLLGSPVLAEFVRVPTPLTAPALPSGPVADDS